MRKCGNLLFAAGVALFMALDTFGGSTIDGVSQEGASGTGGSATNVSLAALTDTMPAGYIPVGNGTDLILKSPSQTRAILDLEPGTDVQAYDEDLLLWAGVTPSLYGTNLVKAVSYAAMRTLLDLEPGTDVQAYDEDLGTWGQVTPSADGTNLVSAANFAAMRSLLGLTIDAGVQVITYTGTEATWLPTKWCGELTLTNAPSFTMSTSASRVPYMLTIYGTNTVTMNGAMRLVGTWTQAGTNYVSIFPEGAGNNWFYGVVTP